jgi:hypothetical protein
VTDFNPGRDEVEDVAAMKREGDLGQFLRQQIRAGRTRRTTPAVASPPPPPPGHRPGAWPSGASPPEPRVQRHSPAAWAVAADEYRDWLTATDHTDRLDRGQVCGCVTCTPNPTEENR